ncbi:L-arabinose transport system permease protein AraQ [Paenibacillus konkukensis]|uniref:L-arabinose transport system permease protein AraQ n=1 Tax=Paenibacillus konkukensis TaxID=2020716 RepID=A0ABY4RP22_9BACL|nr:carbohydrate ABC transporter permease [Paenibacillus konkukensis]UQZ83464.1 L-arabinose transport system permease protein AraQ [Paenibacillus konkukensis]
MKRSKDEAWFYGITYTLLTLASFSVILPFVHVLAVSLSASDAIMAGKVSLLPVHLTWIAYETLFSGSSVARALANSVAITAIGVTSCMLCTFLAAYPLSQKLFCGRKLFTMVIVFTMLFNGGIIPLYLVVKSLGLVDSYWALWLPGLISPFNMLIMKNFFENLPGELEEAARMDGCGELPFIVRILLPLSAPMLATLTLLYAVHFWNSYFSVLIFINDTTKYNLTVLIQQMISNASSLSDVMTSGEVMSQQESMKYDQLSQESVKSAGIFMFLLPMLLIYPFLQRFFVKGMMIGAIKG